IDFDAIPIRRDSLTVARDAEDADRGRFPGYVVQLVPSAARGASLGNEPSRGFQRIGNCGLWREVDRPQILVFVRGVSHYAALRTRLAHPLPSTDAYARGRRKRPSVRTPFPRTFAQTVRRIARS